MPKYAPILLVEDNSSDAALLQGALRQSGLPHPLKVVPDAEHLVHYLEGSDPYHNRQDYPLPGLILLDLDLPHGSGFEVLTWRKTSRLARRIPVIVMSCKCQPEDVNNAYELGANSYLLKPSDSRFLREYLQTIIQYWLQFNQAPE